MRNMTFEPARPLDTDGWSELMRLEPGSAVAVQRHTGEVIESVNAETQRAVYLAWCQEHGVDPAEQLAG